MKNCKKLFIVLAFTALLIAALCASAFAAEAVDSGQCGDDVYWELDSDGVLTISGTGAMTSHPWRDNNRYGIKKVTIANGVTTIGAFAFYDCESLTSVTIPNSVTTIGDSAFYYCTSLTSVTIPDSVTTIGDDAFYYCTSLTSVTIPNSVTAIGNYAFCYCTSLTSMTIPNSVTAIGNYAFCYCTSLTSVTIPNSVTTIGDEAFNHCTSLTGIWVDGNNPNYSSDSFGVLFNKNKSELIQAPGAITEYSIPDSVATISDWAFDGCTSLTSVTIPNSVTTIGSWAFGYCTSLTSVTIPNSVTTIGSSAFRNCTSLTGIWVDGNNHNYSSDSFGVLFNKNKSELIQAPGAITEYSIPDSVTTIGYGAFSDCTSLTSVTIPNSVTTIGNYVFYDCTSLTSVTIPGSVTTIGYEAFYYCTSLTSVTIGDKVTTIGEYAFYNCTSLKDVYFSGTEEQWNKIDIDSDNECLTNATIHYNSSGAATGHTVYSSGDNGIDRRFTFNKDEEVENLVLDTIATIYNPRLAHFLSNMARSAYNESLLADNYSELGISVIGHNNFDDFFDGSASYYIGKKELAGGSTMVFITIRGSYGFSWGTDFAFFRNAVFGGWHDGFTLCAEILYENLKQSLGGTIPTNNVRYVITGHSLGGAVGNLVAMKLNETGVPMYNVYDYNFACPDVANDWPWAWNHNGEHNNIFNIGNCQDIVTFVPGVVCDGLGPVWLQWGKYGQSVWFSENWNNLDYVMLNPPTHDMVYYVDYLAKERPFSEFRDYNGVHGEVLKNQIKTLLFIQCPVDVTVYNSDGVPVAGVTGGEVNYYDSEVGDVLIFLNGDEKYIMLPDGDYTVSLTATDNGTMTYTVLTADPVSGESYGGTQFADVELTKGEGFISETSTSKDTTLYITDSSGNKAKEIKGEAVNSVTPVVRGDVNGDGEMNNSDLVTVARYIVGLCDENTARIVEYMADMDGDEVVNNTDLVTVARIIVGL